MLLGYFKKMVIADNLAPIVNAAFNDVAHASGWQLLWATYAFAFQIYCDFSGYTDIAIGTAKLFNLHLMRNSRPRIFRRCSAEFWRRWHISLSTWFREYVNISLGGNRTSRPRQAFNIAAVFLLSGFWHGANWTFMVWGGCRPVLSRLLAVPARQPSGPGRGSIIGAVSSATVITFHLVCFAWIFFRATSLADAGRVISRIAHAIYRLCPLGFPRSFSLGRSRSVPSNGSAAGRPTPSIWRDGARSPLGFLLCDDASHHRVRKRALRAVLSF